MDKVLKTRVVLKCCKAEVSLLECVPKLVHCHNCGEALEVSWCAGKLSLHIYSLTLPFLFLAFAMSCIFSPFSYISTHDTLINTLFKEDSRFRACDACLQ